MVDLPDYTSALSQARLAHFKSQSVALEEIEDAYKRLLLSVLNDASTGRITADRAQEIAQSVRREIAAYGIQFQESLFEGLARSSGLAARGHKLGLDTVAKTFGASLSTSFADVPAFALEWMVHRRQFAQKYGVDGFSGVFQTLVKRNLQAQAGRVDRILTTAVGQGVDSRETTLVLAELLAGGEDNLLDLLGPRGGFRRGITAQTKALLDPSLLKSTRSLLTDSRRIAIHESNSAFDESDKLASARSPMIGGLQWTRSGRHKNLPSTPDRCDFYAEFDYYGLGPGVFPPESVPILPHPLCLCTTRKLFRPPSEWSKPKPAPPAPADLSQDAAETIAERRITRYSSIRDATSEGFDRRVTRELQEAERTVSAAYSGRLDASKPFAVASIPKTSPPKPESAFIPPSTKADAISRLQSLTNELPDNLDPNLPIAGKTRINPEFSKLSLSDLTDILEGIETTLRGNRLAHIGFEKTKGRNSGRYVQAGGEGRLFIRKSALSKPFWVKQAEIFKQNKAIDIAAGNRAANDPRRHESLREKGRLKVRLAESTTRWTTVESTTRPVLALAKHEAYHAVYYQTAGIREFWERETLLLAKEMGEDYARATRGVSQYGSSSITELFPELGTAIDLGLDVHPKLRDLFERALKAGGLS